MKNILLIEDDPFLVNIYTTKLKESGFSTDAANDGETGLKKLKEKEFDLLILDIVLPHIDGWEILKEIRKEDGLKDLKVIILSNLGRKEEVEKGLGLGAVKYFIKAHYTPSEIVEEIKKII
ncbi:MAG: response regulator [Patescibacteria group bacterium]|nr:response regulator [Patescibacteria group bacterium]